MKASPKGLEFIKRWEGYRLKPYLDSAGLLTIGVGHLIVDGDPVEKWRRLGITHEKAFQLLQNDIGHAEYCVNSYIEWPLNQNQFDALVSFTFNVGGGALRASTLRKRLNGGEEGKVGHELLRWNKERNPETGRLRVSKGLSNRRKAEAKLFNLGVYE